jgi:hypothetical protein
VLVPVATFGVVFTGANNAAMWPRIPCTTRAGYFLKNRRIWLRFQTILMDDVISAVISLQRFQTVLSDLLYKADLTDFGAENIIL